MPVEPLRPFFPYFGAKWRTAPHYPTPTRGTIIEPFAGAAGYSLRYPDRRVVLIDASPQIAGIWRYLTRASPAEILRLPLLGPGERIDAHRIPVEAQWLIGMWLSPGSAGPRKTMVRLGSNWSSAAGSIWGERARARIAAQVDTIRHWVVSEGAYTTAPNIAATWFIDPPYEGLGHHYPASRAGLDYPALADWCRSRRGQVIVCENTGADWLPFRHLINARGKNRVSREAIWLPEQEVRRAG